jgi:hypothetical protein
MPEPDTGRAKVALATLARLAMDLGKPGPDTTYGHGLVGDTLRIELAAPVVLAK